jgi:hypothetical protein
MTSQQIRTLLASPNVEDVQSNVLLLLNTKFKSVDDLDGLDSALTDARSDKDVLASEVRL